MNRERTVNSTHVTIIIVLDIEIFQYFKKGRPEQLGITDDICTEITFISLFILYELIPTILRTSRFEDKKLYTVVSKKV